MTFIHGYLLGGLVLAGLPILVHLAMRQKPRQLAFPAFRFLKRRLHVNRRRLRLQHLLLLALRMAVIAALCLALVRPSIESNADGFNAEQPVNAVFLFDTRPSMEYVVGDESRLKAARRSAEGLLAAMDDRSRVAVLDCGDDPDADADRSTSLTQARARVKGLTTRPAAHAVNAHLGRAYRVLNNLAVEDPTAPRLLYIFSDRTRPGWATAIKAEELPQGVRAVFVDVGVEEPHDLAIERIEIVPPVVEPGKKMQVLITVRGTGTSSENEIFWRIDNDADADSQSHTQKFLVGEGKEKTIAFPAIDAPALPPKTRTAAIQITAKLRNQDALTFNNSRTATFLVRNRPSVLTIADDPEATTLWKAVFRAIEDGRDRDRPLHKTFRCEVVAAKALKNLPENATDDPQLAHDIVCLYQMEKVPAELWSRLQKYVQKGGNLIIVPGGNELSEEDIKHFNADGQKADLLPATLVKVIDAPGGEKKPTELKPFGKQHPITKKFVEWAKSGVFDFNHKTLKPSFARYWEAVPVAKEGVGVVLTYDDDKSRPALLVREYGRGRVLMFTTPLDNRRIDKLRSWSNIWESSFGLVLIDLSCLYLAGGQEDGEVNFVCGKPVLVPLLTRSGDKQYLLKGPPGLTLSETKVPAPEGRLLAVPQANQPGNYTVVGEGGDPAAAFSVNIAAEESRLERVPAAEIEAALGDDSLLPPGQAPRLQDAVKGGRAGQIELLPWLLMVVLLVLSVESVLANKFYKREATTPETSALTAPPATAAEPLAVGAAARSG